MRRDKEAHCLLSAAHQAADVEALCRSVIDEKVKKARLHLAHDVSLVDGVLHVRLFYRMGRREEWGRLKKQERDQLVAEGDMCQVHISAAELAAVTTVDELLQLARRVCRPHLGQGKKVASASSTGHLHAESMLLMVNGWESLDVRSADQLDVASVPPEPLFWSQARTAQLGDRFPRLVTACSAALGVAPAHLPQLGLKLLFPSRDAVAMRGKQARVRALARRALVLRVQRVAEGLVGAGDAHNAFIVGMLMACLV